MKLRQTFFLLLLAPLFAIALCPAAFSQSAPAALPQTAKSLTDFVPAGWKQVQKIEGDLDADKIPETVLILQSTDAKLIKETAVFDYTSRTEDPKTGETKYFADNNPFAVAVIKKAGDSYKLITQNDKILPVFENEWYRWTNNIAIQDGIMELRLVGRISSGISDNFGETAITLKFKMFGPDLFVIEAEERYWFQAMLARNGRTDRYQKLDFVLNKGYVTSTFKKNAEPQVESLFKMDKMVKFEEISTDLISHLKNGEDQSPNATQVGSKFRAPGYSAKELGPKIVQLIKSIDGVDKMSATNIENVFGGKIMHTPQEPGRYGYAGKIAGTDWHYQVFSMLVDSEKNPRMLEISLENDDEDAELLPVCGYSFDDFKKALTTSGFTVKPVYGEHGRLLAWNFENGKIEVSVKAYKYEKAECIKSVWVRIR